MPEGNAVHFLHFFDPASRFLFGGGVCNLRY